MNNNDLFFGLNDKLVDQNQEKYALIEPLIGDYLSPAEKRIQRKKVIEELQISDRTLRRMVGKLKKKGICGFVRKIRNDAGVSKVFSETVLTKARALLEENPHRSVRHLMTLLALDTEITDVICNMSQATLYRHLKKSGYDFQNREKADFPRQFHKFEALYPNALWQGDARDGIPIPHPKDPKKTKQTYLFVWIDDFSRKIMSAQYYWDEKLPRMEDGFRQAVLRWGMPEKLYCDNGKVYISNHFLYVVTDLKIKKIHHPAYSAWCKGKVEIFMKLAKQFQSEARLAGFKTLDELNSALWAWIDIEYHHKIHSSTGETPHNRFADNVGRHLPKRVKDIEEFNSLFLWRETRTLTKYGQVSVESNHYSVPGVAPRTKVEVRFNPFDLAEVQIYRGDVFITKAKANVLHRKYIEHIPEERPLTTAPSSVSIEYFASLRKQYNEKKLQELNESKYSDLPREDTK